MEPLYLSRYSSANMEGTLSRQQNYDADGFSCSVAPQYWTWGNHMKGRWWQLCNLGLLLFTRKRGWGGGDPQCVSVLKQITTRPQNLGDFNAST